MILATVFAKVIERAMTVYRYQERSTEYEQLVVRIESPYSSMRQNSYSAGFSICALPGTRHVVSQFGQSTQVVKVFKWSYLQYLLN